MKRFTVPCDFNGTKYPFHVYVGEPHPKRHPLHFQSWWLSTIRGGTVPQEVMDSFERLHKISLENNVSFEDLCVYALGDASKSGNHNITLAESAPAAPAQTEPAHTEIPSASKPTGDKPTSNDPKLDDAKRTISLVYGIVESGQPFWCYVAVRPSRYDEFQLAQREGRLDLHDFATYGEVIVSGEGQTPPEEVTRKVAEMYQIDPQALLELCAEEVTARHATQQRNEPPSSA